jgi:hypothetical protein
LQAAEQFGRDRLSNGGDVEKKCGNNNGEIADTSYTMAQSKVLYLQRVVRIDYTFAMHVGEHASDTHKRRPEETVAYR